MRSLRSLRDFTVETDIGLLQPLEEDSEALVDVMKHLARVRERQIEYDSMFEPLADILHLLKTYNVPIPKDVYVMMDVCCSINNDDFIIYAPYIGIR